MTQTAEMIQATRRSVREWRNRYEQYGEAGLAPHPRGRPSETVTEELCNTLIERRAGITEYLRLSEKPMDL